ncbi:MAG: primosomal protein N', partial [Bradymonadaceae bacterium]
IVIGARSALFAPLSELGVIVVDEEHDTSFKQERGPRYNARDMALVRGKLESARVILGSATPSLESYYNSRESGRLTYLSMPERVDNHPMPDVDIVDMRRRSDDDSSPSHILSPQLYEALQRTLTERKQAILFLNRRGFSPCVLCPGCGHVFECPNCDVSLTYHRRQEALRCHHCDYSLRMPESCPECGDKELDKRGIGTEQLETHLHNVFSDAVIARLDRDTTTGKQLRKLIREFREENVDILAGTQMVTKGHDFPGVVTVGVVSADLSLNFPDFRSPERTFQLLTQVAGRAGRGTDPGRVYVQTYNPDHYAIEAAADHDYEEFAERELSLRKELSYPPYGHLIAVKFESKSNARATQAARDYASAARSILRDHRELAERTFMVGPAMAPLSRLKGRSRWQLLLEGSDRSRLRETANRMLAAVDHFGRQSDYRNVRIIVDVDPVNML